MLYDNYKKIAADINDAKLLAVSKHQEAFKIQELYDNGVREFGENRIEELKVKCNELPSDIVWHFIGRIQSKKIKDIVKCADLIHSVDSLKALKLIDKEAGKIDKVQKVLIQLNVSEEESKTGFDENDLVEVMKEAESLSNVEVVGLMTMAPFTSDEVVLRNVFSIMQSKFEEYDFDVLSMGMSNDYKIAIEYGANLIRVGTSIFGKL